MYITYNVKEFNYLRHKTVRNLNQYAAEFGKQSYAFFGRSPTSVCECEALGKCNVKFYRRFLYFLCFS